MKRFSASAAAAAPRSRSACSGPDYFVQRSMDALDILLTQGGIGDPGGVGRHGPSLALRDAWLDDVLLPDGHPPVQLLPISEHALARPL